MACHSAPGKSPGLSMPPHRMCHAAMLRLVRHCDHYLDTSTAGCGYPAGAAHRASVPRSPVLILTTCSTGTTHTLPSPILPVWPAFTTASTTASTC